MWTVSIHDHFLALVCEHTPMRVGKRKKAHVGDPSDPERDKATWKSMEKHYRLILLVLTSAVTILKLKLKILFCHNQPKSKSPSLLSHCYDLFLLYSTDRVLRLFAQGRLTYDLHNLPCACTEIIIIAISQFLVQQNVFFLNMI